MKKKWLALAVTGALCLSLTACNSDGKTEEAKADTSSEKALADYKEARAEKKAGAGKVSEKEAENEDEKTDEKEVSKALNNNFVSPLCAFEMTVNGDTLKIPMSYSDLEEAGWTFEGDDFIEIEGYLSEFGQSWTKNGVTIDVTMTNPTAGTIIYTDAVISEIEYTPYSIHDNSSIDTVVLPGGVQLYETTYDEMVTVYGEPDVLELDYNSLHFAEYYLDENHNVMFSIDAETNIVDGVEFDCVDAFDNGYVGINYVPNNNTPAEVPTETPAEVPTETPAETPVESPELVSAVSLDPADMQFELDGVVYQLPCATQELLDNGWEITEGSDAIIAPDNFGFGVLEKNGVEFNVYFMSENGEEVSVENSHVVGLTQMYIDEVYPFVISGDITLGAPVLEEHIMNVFADMDIEVDDSDSEYIFYDINSMDGELGYSIGVNEGIVRSMTIELD